MCIYCHTTVNVKPWSHCVYVFTYICHHHLGPTLLGPCVLAIVPRNLSADPKTVSTGEDLYILCRGYIPKLQHLLVSPDPKNPFTILNTTGLSHFSKRACCYLIGWFRTGFGHQTVGCGQRWYLDSWLVFFEGCFADSMDMLDDITFQGGLSKVDIGRWWLL